MESPDSNNCIGKFTDWFISGEKKQEAQRPWHSAWLFARLNQHIFMNNGNVDEVTHLQSAVYV